MIAKPPLSQMGKTTRNKRNRTESKRKIKEHITSGSINNLSNLQLSDTQISLLQRGLSFVPTPRNKQPKLPHKDSIAQLINNINTRYFFRKDTKPKPAIHRPTGWTAPENNNLELNQFIDDLHQYSYEPVEEEITSNISELEYQALKQLKDNKDIIIKEADKGKGVVLMNREDYIKKANEHLHDTNTYRKVDFDHTQLVKEEVESYLIFLKAWNYLPDKHINFIQPCTPPRTPLFYFLPKIHKEGSPPRPITSGCDSPTAFMSAFLTKILTPVAEAQPTYLRNGIQLLNLLEDIKNHGPLEDEAILCTADVSSLYTNIPTEEGIQIVMERINQYKTSLPSFSPPVHVIRNMLHLVLENNYFQFGAQFYLQIRGTAMGTRVAPPFANLFMTEYEQRIINLYQVNIKIWKRYLDDIFFIFVGKHTQLQGLQRLANEIHPTIKLTFECSNQSVNFLDMTIFKTKQGLLSTDLYRKPTDKHLILHHNSHHPQHIKRNIILGEAYRYKRIVSNPHTLNRRLSNLTHIFVARGYPLRMIKRQINLAKLVPRKSLLATKIKTQEKNPIHFKVDPHHTKSKLRNHIRQAWAKNIKSSETLKLLGNYPRMISLKNPTLKDILVHTELK